MSKYLISRIAAEKVAAGEQVEEDRAETENVAFVRVASRALPENLWRDIAWRPALLIYFLIFESEHSEAEVRNSYIVDIV